MTSRRRAAVRLAYGDTGRTTRGIAAVTSAEWESCADRICTMKREYVTHPVGMSPRTSPICQRQTEVYMSQGSLAMSEPIIFFSSNQEAPRSIYST